MTKFYSGAATIIRGSREYSGDLVFTDTYCIFTSIKYNCREVFDDGLLVSAHTVEISIPALLGSHKKKGVSICYDNWCIGDFILEYETPDKVISKIEDHKQSIKKQQENAEYEIVSDFQKTQLSYQEVQKMLNYAAEEVEESWDVLPDELKRTSEGIRVWQKYEQIKSIAKRDLSQYNEFLRQRQISADEKNEILEKKREEAIGKERGEIDEAFMYITLMIEEAAGDPNKDDEDFVKTYADDFIAYDDYGIQQLRQSVEAILQDDLKCQYYLELFKKQSLVERFNYSTGNLFTISHHGLKCIDIDAVAERAINKTAILFDEIELYEVQEMMEGKKNEIRKKLDSQFDQIEHDWTDYIDCLDYLVVSIEIFTGDNYQPASEFQKRINQYVVKVILSTKDLVKLTSPVENLFCWYWASTVDEIWEQAIRNEIRCDFETDFSKLDIAIAAFDQVTEKWTGTRKGYKIKNELPAVERNTQLHSKCCIYCGNLASLTAKYCKMCGKPIM